MTRRQWATGLLGLTVAAGGASLVPATVSNAAAPVPAVAGSTSVDATLGNGLGRLLAQSERPSMKRQGGFRMDQEALTVRDDQGRVLVDVTPRSGVDRAAFRKQAEKLGLVVRSADQKRGTLSGFVALGDVRALAALPDLGTIAQALKPKTRAGRVTGGGVALQRADKVHAKGVGGKGITVAALSDSFDSADTTPTGEPLEIHAAQDVKSGDLPGRGNKRNPNPVVVLDDLPEGWGGTDEGRAMLQIVHDVAPDAKLCFGTAVLGQYDFADKIRALADKKGPCRADVIVDDIGYADTAMFSDNPISDAIDEVAAKGVHYITAAGNNGIQQSWNSPVRLLPAKSALKGTNLDFSEVDPALYDGGLQDLDPGPGTDVAQNLTMGENGGQIGLQWDDPVDADGSTLGAPFFEKTGAITDSSPEAVFRFKPTAAQRGKLVQIRTDAIPSGSTDLVLAVYAPDGTELGIVDTDTSPEVLATTLTQKGTYTIAVSGFEGDTGRVSVDVRPITALSKVTSDFNVLFFDRDGAYLGASADLNTYTGRPFEIAAIGGEPEVQMVVARHGTGRLGATRLRNVLSGELYFTEYSDPLSPAFYGQTLAKGATAVAAYDHFRPFLPQPYTSPGGDLPVYFDTDGNRFRTPQVRRVPHVAGADRGNTTFFAIDEDRDADDLPNFAGTSAAAPHVAGIAALVLQKAGGGKSLTPAKLRSRLQSSTYAHDLDPMVSRGASQGLSITANGAQGAESWEVPGSMTDPRFFTVKYDGKVPLKSLSLYGETASPTALGKRYPGGSDGIVFDPRPFDGVFPFREDGFPFKVGEVSGGLSSSAVSASYAVPGGGESAKGQFRHMTLTFKSGLKKGAGLKFGVDRDLAISGYGGSNEGNGADELGGAVFLPGGYANTSGLTFVAKRVDGTTFRGMMSNRLGAGFSPVDGYGLVNAEKAVLGSR